MTIKGSSCILMKEHRVGNNIDAGMVEVIGRRLYSASSWREIVELLSDARYDIIIPI